MKTLLEDNHPHQNFEQYHFKRETKTKFEEFLKTVLNLKLTNDAQ